MSKENKPYKNLGQQWEAEKQENWERLKERLGIEEPVRPAVSKKSAVWSPKRIAAACASAVLLVGVSVGAGVYFSSLPEQVDNSSSPEDQIRYCTQAEYTPDEVSMTLKEYSLQNNGNILYFNWYDKVEDLKDFSYTLNDTQEIIAFKEEFFNIDNGYNIILSVTDNHTEMEHLSSYKLNCSEKTTIKEIEVQYRFNKTGGYIMWEYEGYRYYMQVMGIMSSDELFALVEELLQK